MTSTMFLSKDIFTYDKSCKSIFYTKYGVTIEYKYLRRFTFSKIYIYNENLYHTIHFQIIYFTLLFI